MLKIEFFFDFLIFFTFQADLRRRNEETRRQTEKFQREQEELKRRKQELEVI